MVPGLHKHGRLCITIYKAQSNCRIIKIMKKLRMDRAPAVTMIGWHGTAPGCRPAAKWQLKMALAFK